ncbi:sulfite exporter TauE/SafE family protein [Haloarcula amylovorans]|uniref:sulfite exporter TauE/SafE family protein n=1 Tax=Haloarcula amylovorans TaxID=2562280 RepID=UPI0010763084|nr:sulfite exporter TauE/SafE family protein [Halomicroarcula amylolytica]
MLDFALPVGPAVAVLLVGIAFFAGVGITTIGPGGIFLTIALYALTPLSPGTIAGTAQATFVATGLVATAAYVRSGELTTGETRTLTIVLSVSSVAGALAGAGLNAFVSRGMFGLLLGGLASSVGGIILYRERRGFMPLATFDQTTTSGKLSLGALGFVLGGFSGLLGVGGPVLAVPALVLVGVPMLYAIAVAQVQSIFIAAFASLGYLAQGTVSLALAGVVGLPLVAGVLVGWRVAHLVDPNRLKVALGGVLLLVGPYLAL